MHTAFLRLSVRYLCPQTALSVGLFHFTAIFGGYLIAGTLTLFILFRIIHGVSFGMVTVSGNTIVIDIMPSSRRGEGLGYYGLANNIAMSIGPMFGLFLHDAGVSFATIFCYVIRFLYFRFSMRKSG